MDKFASVATAVLLARPGPPMHAFETAPPAKDQHQQQQLQRVEERMDSMHDHLLRTQQMIHNLSTLVHRQIKVDGRISIARLFHIVALGSLD